MLSSNAVSVSNIRIRDSVANETAANISVRTSTRCSLFLRVFRSVFHLVLLFSFYVNSRAPLRSQTKVNRYAD